jgi:cytochrome c-type biogenesis protein
MDVDVTVGGAFLAGLLSFVSPCVLPLVPPYLCFLAGTTLDQLTGEDGERAPRLPVFLAALAFVLGFTTVFVMLGASASVIGRTVMQHLDLFGYIAGAIIIIMGLHFLGLFRIGLLHREARVHVAARPAGIAGAYLVGLAFAFGWTPCVGPVLAAILFVAGTRDTVGDGAVLLGIYSLGIGLPFVLASLFAGPFIGLMRRFRAHMGKVEKTMGVLMVLTGVMFLTGQMATMSFWLLEKFPALGQIG